MSENPADAQLLPVAEAARILGVSLAHAYVLMDRGVVPSVRLGHCRRVPRKALERLVERALDGRGEPVTAT